jgi:hypothetical protein
VGRSYVVAGLGTLVTVVLGVGVLAMWSLATPSVDGLPRLTDFYSATWGDGLFLPLAVGSLLLLVARLGTIGRRAIVVLSAVGLLAGVASQAVWLADPAPRLNWTLPAPHQFTAAGWYHAAFLVVASMVFVTLVGTVVIQLRGRPDKAAADSVAFTVFLLAAGGFAALVVRDGAAGPWHLAQLATWVLVVCALLGLVLGVWSRIPGSCCSRWWRHVLRSPPWWERRVDGSPQQLWRRR